MVKRETGPGDGLTVSVNPPLFSELRAAQRETRSRIPPRTTCSAQPVSTGYPEKSARKRRSKHFVGFFFWSVALQVVTHQTSRSSFCRRSNFPRDGRRVTASIFRTRGGRHTAFSPHKDYKITSSNYKTALLWVPKQLNPPPEQQPGA